MGETGTTAAAETTTARVHFYVVAIGQKYERFAALHVALALSHNGPESTAEVVVESVDGYLRRFGADWAALLEKAGFGGEERGGRRRVFLRASRLWNAAGSPRGALPFFAHSLRFLEEPEHAGGSELTYIGDVDVLILEPVAPFHLAEMRKTGLPFSNWVRPNSGWLTGLHCARTRDYFPAVRPTTERCFQEILRTGRLPDGLPCDEALLAAVCREHWPLEPIRAHTRTRPIFGVHFSLTRAGFERLAASSEEHASLVNKARPHQKDALRRFASSPPPLFSGVGGGEAFLAAAPEARKIVDEVLRLREGHHPNSREAKLRREQQ